MDNTISQYKSICIIENKHENPGKQSAIVSYRPVLVNDYYTNLIKVDEKAPGYVELMNMFGLSETYGVIKSWSRYSCKTGHVFYYPNAECGRNNPFFLWGSIRRAASRTMRTLEKFRELNLVYDITLTYPKEVSDLVKTRKIESECNDCFLDLQAWLSEQIGGKIAISQNLHLWKSENPLEPHAHHHSLLLDVYLVDGKKHKITTKRFMTWDKKHKKIAQSEFSKTMKHKWAEIVSRHFNVKYDELDVHIEYRNIKREPHRIVHKLKYNRRTPLPDLAEYYTKHEFDKGMINKRYISKLISYKNRVHVYGYWNRLSKLLCTIDNFENERKRMHCPICGRECVERGQYQVNELPKDMVIAKIDRGGGITYTKPIEIRRFE